MNAATGVQVATGPSLTIMSLQMFSREDVEIEILLVDLKSPFSTSNSQLKFKAPVQLRTLKGDLLHLRDTDEWTYSLAPHIIDSCPGFTTQEAVIVQEPQDARKLAESMEQVQY